MIKRFGALMFLLLIAALGILACKGEEKPVPAPPSGSGSAKPGPTAEAKPKPGKELNLFAWSEYVPQEVIDGFTKETGIKVNYEAYASNEEMLSKLLAGGTKY